MKKKYIKPVLKSIECHTDPIMVGSNDQLKITDVEANDCYEVLGRKNKSSNNTIWDLGW